MPAIILQRTRSGFGAVEAGRISNDNTNPANPPLSPMVLLPGQIQKTIQSISFGAYSDPVYSANAVGAVNIIGRMVVVKSVLPIDQVYDPIFSPQEFGATPVYRMGDFRQGGDILYEMPYVFGPANGVISVQFPGEGLSVGEDAITILVTPPYGAYPVTIGIWEIARLHLSVSGKYPSLVGGKWR